MISETIDEIRGGDVRNATELYDKYTRTWLDVEAAKGMFRTLVSREDRLFFSQMLALNLFISGEESLHFTDLTGLVAGYFQLNEYEDIDHFSSDVRTCTFLQRSDDGHYSFAHKSFLEYFCACAVSDLITEQYEIPDSLQALEDITLWDLEERMPNIFHFLDQLAGLPLAPSFWEEINPLVSEGIARGQLSLRKESSWDAVVHELAEGGAYLGELWELVQSAQPVYRALVEAIQSSKKVAKKETWFESLALAVANGSTAKEMDIG